MRSPVSSKRPPAGPVRLLLRAPVLLYRLRLGVLFGRRVLLLTHRGRVSGRDRHTPLEVVHDDRSTGEVFVISGWGPRSDWYRNLRAHPYGQVCLGSRRYRCVARLLDTDAGAEIMHEYCRAHPWLARVLARWALGQPYQDTDAQRRLLSGAMPVVAFAPDGGGEPE